MVYVTTPSILRSSIVGRHFVVSTTGITKHNHNIITIQQRNNTLRSFVTTSSTSVSSLPKEQRQFTVSTLLSPSQVQLNNITLSSLLEQRHDTNGMMIPKNPNETNKNDDDDAQVCAMIYCLSFAQEELDFQRNYLPVLDTIMKQQLQYNQQYQTSMNSRISNTSTSSNVSKQQQQQQPQVRPIISVDTAPLPTTLEDALRSCKSRAIVITEKDAPFRIVNVNPCWEQLCGYTYIESKGKTLGSLLHGPKTDPLCGTSMISKLLSGESEVGTTIINYKKNGTPFINRIRAGPIYNTIGQITHFVGVLQEMTNNNSNETTYYNHQNNNDNNLLMKAQYA